jgi:hypothetical protein
MCIIYEGGKKGRREEGKGRAEREEGKKSAKINR